MGLFNLSLYISALGIALMGSGHCFGMCGSIAAVVGIKRAPSYHFGRALGYAVVGGISGALGQGLFESLSAHPGVMIALVTLFLIVFFLQGFLMWTGSLDSSWVTGVQRRLYGRFVKDYAGRAARANNGWLYGLTTVLIPCGWTLYFSWIAATSGSAVSGAIIFLMLWLGSLPALLAATGAWNYFRNRFRGTTARRVMASAVFLLSLASLAHRFHSLEHSTRAGDVKSDAVCGPEEPKKSSL